LIQPSRPTACHTTLPSVSPAIAGGYPRLLEANVKTEHTKNHRIFTTSFASVYPHYVQKAEKKGRTRQEVDEVIRWLTGYSQKALEERITTKVDFQTFFGEAPGIHPNVDKITGVVCGVRIEDIEHPLMRNIRYLDKLVDELAKGRPMEKILRQ
jgi:hypothetical protein